MARPEPRSLATVSAVATLALIAAAITLLALLRTDASYASAQSWSASLPDVALALAYALVGVVVTLKRPANLVGWALVVAGLGMLLAGIVSGYGELAVLAHPDAGLPAGAAAASISAGSWTPLMAGVFMLLATFPSGAVETRRRCRWVIAVLTGFGLVWVLITLGSPQLEAPLDDRDNPLAVPGSTILIAVAIPIIVFCLGSIVAAGIDLVRRFRRSAGLERQQFKWLAASGGLLVATLPFAATFNWSRVAGAVFTVELIALPVAVGIAVLRYRLFEIDRLVSRTITYGVLTAVLVGAYAGLVLGGQALFSSFAGGSNLAIAVSTLVVAALFLPARSLVQRFVDRRFNRRRFDAQRTLEGFGATLREQVDLETLRSGLVEAVDETMQPAHVGVWLRAGAP